MLLCGFCKAFDGTMSSSDSEHGGSHGDGLRCIISSLYMSSDTQGVNSWGRPKHLSQYDWSAADFLSPTLFGLNYNKIS